MMSKFRKNVKNMKNRKNLKKRQNDRKLKITIKIDLLRHCTWLRHEHANKTDLIQLINVENRVGLFVYFEKITITQPIQRF